MDTDLASLDIVVNFPAGTDPYVAEQILRDALGEYARVRSPGHRNQWDQPLADRVAGYVATRYPHIAPEDRGDKIAQVIERVTLAQAARVNP